MFKKIVLPLTLFGLALAGLAVQYRSGHPVHSMLFSSDGLFLPVLFADLFGQGGSISDWYLTPAPYFFPDYPLFALAYFSSDGAFHQSLVFAILQMTAITLGAAWVIRAYSRDQSYIAAAATGATLLWLALNATEPYIQLLTSAYHTGAFVSALAFVAFWLHRDTGLGRGRQQVTWMCLLAFISALSDTLFLVQTIAPFVFTCLLMRRKDTAASRAAALPYAAVVIAALLGNASYRLVVSHRTRYPTDLGLGNLMENLNAFSTAFSTFYQQVPVLAILLLAYFALGLVCLVRVAMNKGFLGLPRPILSLWVFSTAGAGANLTAMLLVTNLVVTPRYMIPVFGWPIVVTAALLIHWCGKYFAGLGLAASAALAAAIGINANRSLPPPDQVKFREQSACIYQALAAGDARHGIAQYWDAKALQAFSPRDITVAQYLNTMGEHRWITSSKYFKPVYDFAVITPEGGEMYTLPREQIIAENGQPTHEKVCGDRTVLVYGHGKLRAQKIFYPGDSYLWKGCKLPTLIGKPTAACTVEKADPNATGYLTFGPMEPLPAGEYSFEQVYSSEQPADVVAGSLDVVLALPAEAKQVALVKLMGTSGQASTIKGSFTIAQRYNGIKIEARTHSDSGGAMQVHSLRVTRVR